ncbi:transmembrane and ubiquitin-like domain-containing protein 1 [Rhinophrynus dorsalis]
MALIEGVGDEVTLLFALVLFLIVLVLAWVSTHTAERLPSPWVQSSAFPTESSSGSQTLREPTDSSPSSSQTLNNRNVLPNTPLTQSNSEPLLRNEPSQTDRDTDYTDQGTEQMSSIAYPPEINTEPSHTPSNSSTPGNNGLHLWTESTSNIVQLPINSDLSTSNRVPPFITDPSLRHRERGGGRTQSGQVGDAGTIVLRLKFLNDTERLVTVRPSDTIMYIKRTHFPGQENHVRLIFQGQLLRDDSQTVSSLQLRDGCVIHCHISQHASVPGFVGAEQAQVPLNIGNLLVPLLALILVLLWYCQVQYPYLFTATATACLAGVTLLISVIALSSFRR